MQSAGLNCVHKSEDREYSSHLAVVTVGVLCVKCVSVSMAITAGSCIKKLVQVIHPRQRVLYILYISWSPSTLDISPRELDENVLAAS